MGAAFNFITIHKDQTRSEVANTVENVITAAAYESGHGGYTGTWAECTGVAFSDKTFPTVSEAEDYLLNEAQKWGPALVVKTDEAWAVGAWCSE